MHPTSCFGGTFSMKIRYMYMVSASLITLIFLWTQYEMLWFASVFNIHVSIDNILPSNGTSSNDIVMIPGDLDIRDTSTHQNRTSSFTRSQKCSRKKLNVSFLKVHKAGSTTVMSIFLRFAIENKLNLVLPRKSNGQLFNYLGFGKTISRERIVPLPTNESYNILCNHVVYNKEAFHSILPDDTIYIGILREPVSQFKSAALYYAFYRSLRKISTVIPEKKIVSEFLKDPSKGKVSTHFVHNRMSFDFGIPKQQFNNDTFINSYINELSQDYSVILILEYLPESLVLMRRELCWSTKDILYAPLNALKKNLNFELSDDDKERLTQWNSADVKLYEHFLKVLKEKVGSLGDDFQEEVEYFTSLQSQVETFCKQNVSNTDTAATLTIPGSKWDASYKVTKTDCFLMMEPEKPMIRRLIENAWARYYSSISHKM